MTRGLGGGGVFGGLPTNAAIPQDPKHRACRCATATGGARESRGGERLAPPPAAHLHPACSAMTHCWLRSLSRRWAFRKVSTWPGGAGAEGGAPPFRSRPAGDPRRRERTAPRPAAPPRPPRRPRGPRTCCSISSAGSGPLDRSCVSSSSTRSSPAPSAGGEGGGGGARRRARARGARADLAAGPRVLAVRLAPDGMAIAVCSFCFFSCCCILRVLLLLLAGASLSVSERPGGSHYTNQIQI